MIKTKRIFALALSVLMLLCLTACGEKEIQTPTVTEAHIPEIVTSEPAITETKAPAETETAPVESAPLQTEVPEVTEELPTEAPAGTEAPEKLTSAGDWKDFTFTLNGQTYQLPMSYKELKEATGLSIKETEEKSWLEPNYYSWFSLRDADGNMVVTIDILNTSDENAEIGNCTVISVSQDDYKVEASGIVIEIAGLKVGDVTTKEDLLTWFGEPNNLYEYRIKETDDQSLAKYETDTFTWCMNPNWTTDNYFKVVMNIHTGIIEELHMDNTP